MTEIQCTQADRIQALRAFGYSDREAEFLCSAALHSGYFLRRQYLRVANGNEDSVAELVERLFAHGHATATAFDRQTHLYHLCARPFYAAIGQEDNRNRRVRECSTVKNKLMALDFVLGCRGARFLATEQEKLGYFTGERGIGATKLPAKIYRSAAAAPTTRYFVEKYPIYIPDESPTRGQGPPAVCFCFVDEGLTTASHFETFLTHYQSLFAALPAVKVTYIAAQPTPFRWAETAFKKCMARSVPAGWSDTRTKRLTTYFALHSQYEAKDFAAFDRAKLLQLRNGQMEFSSSRFADLYNVWKLGGDISVGHILRSELMDHATSKASFSTFLLEHRYDFFGNLTGL